MSYTNSITSKGQITIPKEFRDRLGLDKLGQATLRMNKNDEIVVTAPQTLEEVRKMLRTPTHKDPLSEKEKVIGRYLAKKHEVR